MSTRHTSAPSVVFDPNGTLVDSEPNYYKVGRRQRMRQVRAASRSPTWRRRPPIPRSRRRSCSSSVGRASSRRRSRTRGHRIGRRIAERGARAHRHHGVLPSAAPVRHRLAHPRTLRARSGHHLGDDRPAERVPGLRAGEGAPSNPPPTTVLSPGNTRKYRLRTSISPSTGCGRGVRTTRKCAGRERPSGTASSWTSRDVRDRDATGDAAVMGELLAIGARSGLSDRGPGRTGRPKGSVTPKPHPRVEGKPGPRVRRQLSECGRTTPHRSGRVRSSAPTCWFHLPAHLP